MQKVTKFDKATCRRLEDELMAHIAKFAEERGLKVAPCGGMLDDINFTAKVKFTVDDPVAAEAGEKAIFDKNAWAYGLKPEHFGAVVTLNGKPSKLVGLAISRAKYPLKFKDLATGKVTLYTTDIVAKIVASKAA